MCQPLVLRDMIVEEVHKVLDTKEQGR